MSRMTTKTTPKIPTTTENSTDKNSVYPVDVSERIVMSLDLLDAVLKYDSAWSKFPDSRAFCPDSWV